MSLFRRLLPVLGVVAFAVGIAALLDPAVAGSIAAGRGTVVVIGLLAVALGALFVRQRYRSNPDAFDLPEPERIQEQPVPGNEIDEMLAGVSPANATHRRPDLRRKLHQRLAEAAIEAQIVVEDRERSAAIERLETGEWTDDPHAAALFLGELPSWAPRRLKLRVLLSVRDRYEQRARHGITAITRIVEGPDGEA